VVEAIRRQAGELLHVSNHYHTAVAGELADLLCRHSFADRAFLCNSGTEAVEAAMKLARRWGAQRGGRYEILATHGSFHGRTFGALTATGQEKYHEGVRPLLPGVRLVPYDDLSAMESALAPETVAILVEPIQGEGGIVVPHPEYLRGLRLLADRHDLLLLFDEIQTGVGRTGTLFAYEQACALPDVMMVAKALGGGVPIGAVCATEQAAAAFTPGAHGTTFGGNPLTCAAAIAALRTIAEPSFLEHVTAMGRRLRAGLDALAARHPRVTMARGLGLMQGLVLDGPGGDVVARCLEGRLLVNCTAERVIRVTPPLVITPDEIDEGLAILDGALGAAA
jgi:acetylornithine aminotransferase